MRPTGESSWNRSGADARVVSSFDQQAEATKLAESVQNALAQMAVFEVGAIGIGAIMIAALHTLVLDLTGLLFAGTLAALGLYVLPNRRRKAREELRAQVTELQQQFRVSLSAQFEQELSKSQQNIREAIEPYTRFVRNEREKLKDIAGELEGVEREMRNLKARIEAM